SGMATGFFSLLAFRFLFGIGEAGAYPNMAAVQSRWLPVKSRGRWGGLLWLCARWGGAFSPILFGSMLRGLTAAGIGSVAAPWRIGFLISCLFGLVWCAVFFWWFRNDP